MSNSLKLGIVAVVIILVVIGVAMYVGNQGTVSAPVSQGGNGIPTNDNSGLSASVSATDKSNAALTKDQATLDAELKALDGDSANVDKGLNDAPVSQTTF